LGCLSTAPLAAADPAREPTSAYAELPPISKLPGREKPRLAPHPLEQPTRGFEWMLSGGPGVRPYPASADGDASLSWVVATSFAARPVNWFAWGIAGEITRSHEQIALEGYTLNRVQHGYASVVFARIHWFPTGPSDLYTSVGLGFGFLATQGSVVDTARAVFPVSGGFAPESSVALGWRWRFGQFLSLGPEFNWRYWVSSQRGRCGALPTNQCPFGNAGVLAPQDMLWTLQLTVAVGFGRPQ